MRPFLAILVGACLLGVWGARDASAQIGRPWRQQQQWAPPPFQPQWQPPGHAKRQITSGNVGLDFNGNPVALPPSGKTIGGAGPSGYVPPGTLGIDTHPLTGSEKIIIEDGSVEAYWDQGKGKWVPGRRPDSLPPAQAGTLGIDTDPQPGRGPSGGGPVFGGGGPVGNPVPGQIILPGLRGHQGQLNVRPPSPAGPRWRRW